MNFSIAQIVSWIIVGLIAGSLAGSVLRRSRQGYGRWANWGIGLVGAIVGGLLFSLLRIDFGLSQIAISLADIVQAFVGALLFVGILTLIRVNRKRQARRRAQDELNAMQATRVQEQTAQQSTPERLEDKV
jgi:uncharacterized membrane protein YeaQ/YmgE (transglycosylase-associated protein family)